MKLASIFQNGMILQQEKPVVVWGTATPNEQILIKIQGKEGQSIAKADGTFSIEIPPLTASWNETMILISDSEEITISDIAIGEVWLAGGQSNMEFCMRYEKHKAEALSSCTNDHIRFYDVPEVAYDGQLEDFDYSNMGIWRKACPENLDYFSAVGYYFQTALAADLKVPVGIIGCNWGGTASCAWMSKETVEKAGPAWIELTNNRLAGKDMNEYWASQGAIAMNDRGNLFDPFSEQVMPRTLSEDELAALFANLPGDFQEMMANIVMPQSIPGSLYEHMVKTVSPFAIRGFLWYQGESDDDVPGMNVLYKDMLTRLIEDWRNLWKEELPFLFVQLPGFDRWLMNPPINHYQVIRQCQEDVAKTVPNAYLCSISDIGEELDIHPKNKKDVGERLCLLARHHVYGEEILSDAPTAVSAQKQGNEIVITFEHVGKELHMEGETLNAMQITPTDAPSESSEIEFTVSISGNKLILSLANNEAGPLQIDFAKTMWYQVNLYNEAHIPAIPFSFTV